MNRNTMPSKFSGIQINPVRLTANQNPNIEIQRLPTSNFLEVCYACKLMPVNTKGIEPSATEIFYNSIASLFHEYYFFYGKLTELELHYCSTGGNRTASCYSNLTAHHVGVSNTQTCNSQTQSFPKIYVFTF